MTCQPVFTFSRKTRKTRAESGNSARSTTNGPIRMARLDFRIIGREAGRTRIGESPCRDPETGDLWWVDVTGKRLLKRDEASGALSDWTMPEETGFVVLVGPGRPAVGMQTGIFAFDPERGGFERLVAFDKPGFRFNDAAVGADGRLWTSSMAMDASSSDGEVYRITDDLGLQTIAGGLRIPNGIAVDADRGRLFYSDSDPRTQTIWTRQPGPGAGEIGNPSVFATTTSLPGRPDGATLDRRGFYWIAGVDGGAFYVFDTEGALDATIPVPFPAPTKACFSHPDGRSIAVTSKAQGEDGGFIALADLPDEMEAGIPQPYWRPGGT